MIETCCVMLNKGNKVGAIIMDLSKAFDTLNHNLHFCKLRAYGFNKNFLTFIQSYFTNRHQRTKVEDKFNKWQKSSTGVPPEAPFLVLYFSTFSSITSFIILESVQYNAALAIAGEIRGTSKIKLYKELGLEFLKSRR